MKIASVLKTSFIMLGLTGVSRALSLIREMMIAHYIGMNSLTDAFNVSQSAITMVTTVLGACCLSLVPYLISNSKNEKASSNQLFSFLFLVFMAVCFVLAIFLALFSNEIATLLAPGFSRETVELAGDLLRIGFLKLNCIIAGTMFGYLLQSRQIFISTGIAAVAQNLVVVILIFTSNEPSIYEYTVYTVVGFAVQVIVLIPFVIKAGFSFTFEWGFGKFSVLSELIKSSFPLALVSVLFTLHFVFARIVASELGAGAVSSVDYASKIAQLAFALFTMSLNAILFTKIANLINESNKKQAMLYLLNGVKAQIALIVPLMAVLICFGNQIVAIVYQRGNFTEYDTFAVGSVLLGYSFAILGYVFNDLVSKYLTSTNQYKKINIINAVGYFFSFLVLFLFGKLFGLFGVSLSFALAQVIIAFLYLLVIRKELLLVVFDLNGFRKDCFKLFTLLFLTCASICLIRLCCVQDYLYIGLVFIAAVISVYFFALKKFKINIDIRE